MTKQKPKLFKIMEIGGHDDYLEFNIYMGEATIRVYNPWHGDTDHGFGESGDITISKDQARELATALMEWAND